jgi:hypothetical protein
MNKSGPILPGLGPYPGSAILARTPMVKFASAALAKVEKIGRSTDAFAMSPVAAGSAQRMNGTPTMVHDGSQPLPRPNVAHMWNQQQRATYASQSDGADGAEAAVAGPASERGAPSERRASGSPKAEPEPEPELELEPEAKWRARAIYGCEFILFVIFVVID